jgi:hypothetical protein
MCIECIMAWLLFGDGAICLFHRQPVFYAQPVNADLCE